MMGKTIEKKCKYCNGKGYGYGYSQHNIVRVECLGCNGEGIERSKEDEECQECGTSLENGFCISCDGEEFPFGLSGHQISGA